MKKSTRSIFCAVMVLQLCLAIVLGGNVVIKASDSEVSGSDYGIGVVSSSDETTTTTEAPSGVAINETNFPDAKFREYVSTNFDKDANGYLSDMEIAAVKTIDVKSKSITSLKGIEYFIALTSLDCSSNLLITLDLSNSTVLEYLNCECNQLTALDVSGYTALTYLDCESNYDLVMLNVKGCTALEHLDCDWNKLTILDVSDCTALEWLSCCKTQLTTLDVSKCIALEQLYCTENRLTNIDINGCAALYELWCNDNDLTILDVSSCTALMYLYCTRNQLTSLDLSENTNLISVSLSTQNLSRIIATDTAENVWAVDMRDIVGEANINRVTITGTNVNLIELPYTYSNGIVTFSEMPSVLKYKYNTYGRSESNELIFMDVVLILCAPEVNPATTIMINETNFPDAKFREYVSTNFDKDANGYLSDAEIAAVKIINVYSKGIGSLKGVEYFNALTELYCSYNNLTHLDVSRNTVLQKLACESNQLTTLDVSHNTALKEFVCDFNQLTTLDLSKNIKLSVAFLSPQIINNIMTDTAEMKCTQKYRQKVNINLLVNEFGIAPDSFLLVLRRFYRCCSSVCIFLIHQ